MIERAFWKDRIESAWKSRSIVWLAGVRRSGKTVLVQSLDGVEYFDCELPSVRARIEDPERFLRSIGKGRAALDEIHRLANPSEVLKIASDHFPALGIVATGSSSLSASARFRDTLTGRKTEVWLTPMMSEDVAAFGGTLEHRLGRGGLPPFFMAPEKPWADLREWLESYWARDVLELFRLEKRTSFLRFVEMVLVNSGGLFEAASHATTCGVSRPTISNYLAVLEATRVAHVVHPFSTRRSVELVKMPKVYAFDTGFVACHRGWDPLRPEDLGLLWEHIVLEHLQAHFPDTPVRYWRDKGGREVDFVLAHRRDEVDAIECKWDSSAFDGTALRVFRSYYPTGRNYLVTPSTLPPYTKRYGALEVTICPPTPLRP